MCPAKPSARVLIILGILIIPSVVYLLVSQGKNNYQHLEIFGPKEPVEGKPGDTIYHSLPSFSLVTQDGSAFTEKNLDGKIFVANFFFATCQTICPKMTMQMKRVQEAYAADPEIMLVSHTVNPEKDTAAVLSAYAKEYGAVENKWYFLTGDKKQLYDLARNGYFVTAMPGDGGPDDFIHSEKLILVDKEKRIRGYYDGTDYESVNLLLDEIKVLKLEYR